MVLPVGPETRRTVLLTANLRSRAEVLSSTVPDWLGSRLPSIEESSDAVIKPDQIPIARELIDGHPLEHFISKPGLLNPSDYHQILSILDLTTLIFRSGATSASPNESTDYKDHGWTRDSALISLGLWASGNKGDALRVDLNTNRFYNHWKQRDRFVAYHFHDNPVELYQSGSNEKWPHVRARIDKDGNWVESDQQWPHNQLDAIGMWLWTTFKYGIELPHYLPGMNRHLSLLVNGNNRCDAIQTAALRTLARLNYTEQKDTSMWEDHALPQRGSSTAICCSAFKQAQRFFNQHGWDLIKTAPGIGGRDLGSEIEEAIGRGTEAIQRRIPLDGSFAIETEMFPSDAALAFTLYPFNPGYNRAQENAILAMLYRDRMGEYGFTRRDQDYYLGTDYAHREHGDGIWSDPSHPMFRPAQWNFDPVIGAFYYDRFIRDGKLTDLYLADRHARRALSQFTKTKETFRRVNPGIDVTIPKLRLGEAFWYDSKMGTMRPNHNTPLTMFEAVFAMMGERAMAAHAKGIELLKAA